MSQVTGFPGGGVRLSSTVVVLTGKGNPNSSTTPDVQGAGVGSLFLQNDSAALWQCTAAGVYQAGVLVSASVWVQIS